MRVLLFTQKYHFASNMYLIFSGTEAAIIDPSLKYSFASEAIAENGLTVKYIIVTHAHFDHMLEIDEWVEKTGAKVIVGRDDAIALSNAELNCYFKFFHKQRGYFGKYTAVDDGDKLWLSSEDLTVITSPGHTKGSISLKTDKYLFSGDVIFDEGGFGRFDLPGGNAYQLKTTIDKLCNLDDTLTVYPGHGPETTIKDYKLNRRI